MDVHPNLCHEILLKSTWPIWFWFVWDTFQQSLTWRSASIFFIEYRLVENVCGKRLEEWNILYFSTIFLNWQVFRSYQTKGALCVSFIFILFRVNNSGCVHHCLLLIISTIHIAMLLYNIQCKYYFTAWKTLFLFQNFINCWWLVPKIGALMQSINCAIEISTYWRQLI